MPPQSTPTAPPSDFVPRSQPPDFRGAITRLSDTTVKLDWTNGFLRFIAFTPALFLVSILWMMLVPESSMGVLQFAVQDVHRGRAVVGGVVAAFFMRDIGQALRGIKPRHGMIFVLSGQAVMAVVSIYYTLKGDATLASFAGNFGVFWLSLLSLWTIAQYEQYQFYIRESARLLKLYPKPHALPDEEKAYLKSLETNLPRRFLAKTYLIPGIAIIMFVSALGLITRPDGAIAAFIHNQVGFAYYVFVMAWLVVGSGFITLNHIKAKWLYVAVMGHWLFTVMLMGLFAYDPTSISLTFVVSHLIIAIEAFFIILLQTTYSPEG